MAIYRPCGRPDVDNTIPLHHPENFKVVAARAGRQYCGTDSQNVAESRARTTTPRAYQWNGSIPAAGDATVALVAAERAGDHRPMLIDMNNAMEVRRQMRDYLVSYPRAQEFGFRSYDHWARVRDVPVHRFAEDTTISPRPEVLRSALQHSFFHRGASVHDAERRVRPVFRSKSGTRISAWRSAEIPTSCARPPDHDRGGVRRRASWHDQEKMIYSLYGHHE